MAPETYLSEPAPLKMSAPQNVFGKPGWFINGIVLFSPTQVIPLYRLQRSTFSCMHTHTQAQTHTHTHTCTPVSLDLLFVIDCCVWTSEKYAQQRTNKNQSVVALKIAEKPREAINRRKNNFQWIPQAGNMEFSLANGSIHKSQRD